MQISIPLRCPICHLQVQWDECEVPDDPDLPLPVSATETCPSCNKDCGDFSDLQLNYQSENE